MTTRFRRRRSRWLTESTPRRLCFGGCVGDRRRFCGGECMPFGRADLCGSAQSHGRERELWFQKKSMPTELSVYKLCTWYRAEEFFYFQFGFYFVILFFCLSLRGSSCTVRKVGIFVFNCLDSLSPNPYGSVNLECLPLLLYFSTLNYTISRMVFFLVVWCMEMYCFIDELTMRRYLLSTII